MTHSTALVVQKKLFFHDKGQPAQQALALCAACAVRETCRETFGPLVAYGVVGGATAAERRDERVGRRVGEVAA